MYIEWGVLRQISVILTRPYFSQDQTFSLPGLALSRDGSRRLPSRPSSRRRALRFMHVAWHSEFRCVGWAGARGGRGAPMALVAPPRPAPLAAARGGCARAQPVASGLQMVLDIKPHAHILQAGQVAIGSPNPGPGFRRGLYAQRTRLAQVIVISHFLEISSIYAHLSGHAHSA